MKIFLFKTISLSALIIVIYFITSAVVKHEFTKDYLKAIIDKHKRIEMFDEPIIIIAGGSNTAFGINSFKIEREFKIPVVNLGLHGGLGLSFILEELKYSCKSGDIVFISIEYYLDDGQYQIKKYTSSVYNTAAKFYTTNLSEVINSHIENTRNNLKTKNVSFDSSYFRDGFNKYGDVISHLGRKKSKTLRGQRVFVYRYWEGIKKLNEFNNYATQNNIKVFFMYPNFPKSIFETNKSSLKKYESDLSNNLRMEIINKPEDFVFDDSLFFDTIYHLNAEGREMRTDRLIQIIRNKVL